MKSTQDRKRSRESREGWGVGLGVRDWPRGDGPFLGAGGGSGGSGVLNPLTKTK